ncbi:hypothetical protein ACF0H5_020248 [Mactra antiquata]
MYNFWNNEPASRLKRVTLSEMMCITMATSTQCIFVNNTETLLLCEFREVCILECLSIFMPLISDTAKLWEGLTNLIVKSDQRLSSDPPHQQVCIWGWIV